MKRIEGYITNEEGNLYIEESTGRVFMNQTTLAEVCGVSRQSIIKRLKNMCTLGSVKSPEGIQGIENTCNLEVYIDGVGSLFNEGFVTDCVTYYANKGNKEAIKWMTAIFKVGLRQAVYRRTS